MYFGAPYEFRQDLGRQKNRIPGLLYDIVLWS